MRPDPDPTHPAPGMQAARKRYRARHPERVRKQKRAWKRANPERNRASSRRAYLKATFGITVEKYDEMLAAQGGVCAICAGVSPSGKRLAVDHDHITGRIRGLLCVPCNAALGVLEENLEKVEVYLGS